MNKKMRSCSVCRYEYSYCPRCDEDKDKPHWYFAFHDENCKSIYNTMTDYEWGNISANEAKDTLDSLDLSRFESFGESYKNTYNKIIAEIPKPVIKSKDEITVDVEEVVEDEIQKPKARKIKKDIE